MTTERDLARLRDLFGELSAVALNPVPALNAIGGYQDRRFQIAFDANQTPEGEAWPPLAPSTRAQKQNPKILVERVGRIPASRFFEVQGNKVVVGYGDPLALIHDQGADIPETTIVPRNAEALFWPGARNPVRRVTIPARRLPARGLVGFSSQDLQEWIAIVEDELAGVFSENP